MSAANQGLRSRGPRRARFWLGGVKEVVP